VDLKKYVSAFQNKLNEKIQETTLPTTEQYLISIARVVLDKPKLLIYEESNLLPSDLQQFLLKIIIQLFPKSTIIITTTSKNTVMLTDKVIEFEKGHITYNGQSKSFIKEFY